MTLNNKAAAKGICVCVLIALGLISTFLLIWYLQ
jgi:hypothetical protein